MNAEVVTIVIGLTVRLLLPLLIVLVAGTVLKSLTGQKGV